MPEHMISFKGSTVHLIQHNKSLETVRSRQKLTYMFWNGQGM